MTSRVLLVAGAVSYDYLVCPMTATDDTTSSAKRHADLDDYAHIVVRTGKADLVAQLLTAAAPEWGFEILGPTLLQLPGSSCLKNNASSLIDLSHTRSLSQAQPTFSITRLRHVGKPPVWHAPPIAQATASPASTVIITGSGDAFQDVEPAIDLLQRVRPRYIIHHMTRPLAKGRLWDVIRNGPMTSSGIPEPDHLVVIIDADDLRAEGINLSRSLSWEATGEDFVKNLGSNGRLDTLVTCPNLIVRFGKEGLIHHRGRDAVDPKLYFNPEQTETNTPSDMAQDKIGGASAFSAGFTLGFASTTPPSPAKGIQTGIAAANKLACSGFVLDPTDHGPIYPVDQTMAKILPDKTFTAASLPSSRISSGDTWSLFEALTGDPAEVARQIVISGADKALGHCSIRCFGKYRSIERAEQESLGAVLETMNERLQSPSASPICIGLLGPIGSGKKFVASGLADHISETRAIQKLHYNARILRGDDLIAACQTIRDHAARETLPVVIFENFGTVLEPNSPLLDDFITTMQHGTFNDTGHVRKLGRCLMFFLVDQDSSDSDTAPTPTTTEFALRRRPTTPMGNELKDLRIDDSPLLDSLHGIVRLPGPNQTSSTDRMFAVRRAMMLRQLLLENHPHLSRNGTIEIDDAVMHALLLTPTFKHGLRSLEKIVSTSRLSNRSRFDVSALPPEEQIQLHVDGRTFMAYLRSPKLPPALRERLAQGLFEAYKKQRELMVKTPEQRKELQSDRSYCDWDDLAGELKESTRAQADDIPRKLRAVGCFMLNDDSRTDPLVSVPRFGEEELLMLSEMEHERFNAERLQRQWRMGPRNAKQRTTPFLVPWRDLTQEWKDVDTVMVECVPGILEQAGYRIYRMRGDA